MNIYMSFEDELHCMSLGVSQHILGNVLWHLVYTGIMGVGRPVEKMARIWGRI